MIPEVIVTAGRKKKLRSLLVVLVVVELLERECCLLVLNLVSSTLPCIRQPGPLRDGGIQSSVDVEV